MTLTKLFPEREIKYPTSSKIIIGSLLAADAVTSVIYYKYAAISWWLNIFGIGAAFEWFFNIGPKLDRKRGYKLNYCTFAGTLLIYASFQLLSMIIHHVGWQLAIFVAGCGYIPDGGSYLFGTLIMKPFKIKPWKIHEASPKKSWQALIFGGLPASLFFNLKFIYPMVLKDFLNIYFAVFVIILAVFVGAFGDMFESWTKRQVGIKDSSILLGPMGGFVDRIDSFLTTSFIFIMVYYLH